MSLKIVSIHYLTFLVLRTFKDKDKAYEKLIELEDNMIALEDQDIRESLDEKFEICKEDWDRWYKEDMEELKEDHSKDFVIIDKKDIEENVSTNQMELNPERFDPEVYQCTEEEFTDYQILEKYREFIFQYRLEQKIKKNKNGKNKNNEIQMKKAKPLSQAESEIFLQFLNNLQIEYCEILFSKSILA